MNAASAPARRKAGQKLVRGAAELRTMLRNLLACGYDTEALCGLQTAISTVYALGNRMLNELEQEKDQCVKHD